MSAGPALTALYDASVLYPAAVRNLLMRLALTGLVRARWTGRIHDEWTRAVLRDRPDLARAQLARTRELMDAHAPAVRARADVIVTANLRDFPPEALGPYDIAAWHPDQFVLHLLDLDPAAVAGAAREHRASLRNPPKNAGAYLETLERHGLAGTVAALRRHAAQL